MWLRTTSKFVARMNGCWDSEFDTSIEEIVCLSMKWKDSLCSPSLRSKDSEGVPVFYLGPRYNTKYSLLSQANNKIVVLYIVRSIDGRQPLLP